ncbi:MAG: TIGR00366 family protein, partial [Holdemania massiliensis]
MFGALIVGLSRAIPVIMDNAHIIDTIVYWLSTGLAQFQGIASALGMLFVQNIINFFIPSGGGQAVVTMPILAPVSEMVGLSRQIAVLAFQFGDGFSNIFWPTSVFMMCGIMG